MISLNDMPKKNQQYNFFFLIAHKIPHLFSIQAFNKILKYVSSIYIFKKKLINYTIFKLLSAVRRVLVQFDLHHVQVIPFLTVQLIESSKK